MSKTNATSNISILKNNTGLNSIGAFDGVLQENGTETEPSLTWKSDEDTGVYLKSDGVIAWTIGGSEKMLLKKA